MGYEVDWERAVAASAPQIFALVADWSEELDGTSQGDRATGSSAPAPRTIAWGLQFPTHAVVWFADKEGRHGCATFASAEGALIRLSLVFDLRLVWPATPAI
jgi:hypothetical protein